MKWLFNLFRTIKEVEDESIRPWGHYDILYDGNDCKVKRITVKTGGKLSYQVHQKRDEDWVVISGYGLVVLNDVQSAVNPGCRIHINSGMKHRIQNTGTADLVFVEVQTGSYFGEDDIIRFDDVYGRGDNA